MEIKGVAVKTLPQEIVNKKKRKATTRHTFDMTRGTHIQRQRNQKAKVRGTKGAFGGKK